MAFDRTRLSGNIGGSSGTLRLFTYNDTDSTKAQIAAADYFLDVYLLLQVNDMILIGGSDGSVMITVTASSISTVTTAEMVSLQGDGVSGTITAASATADLTFVDGVITAFTV